MLHRSTLHLSTTLFCVGMLAGCAGGPPEERLPVKTGDFFEYERIDGSSTVKQTERIDIALIAEDQLRYGQTLTKWDVRRPERRDERLQQEYRVTASGHILSFFDGDRKFNDLGKQQTQGRLIHLWLPTASRTAGASVLLKGFPDALPIGEQKRWERWMVWPAEYGGHRFHFDVQTGFLVGREWQGQKWLLSRSSIAGI